MRFRYIGIVISILCINGLASFAKSSNYIRISGALTASLPNDTVVLHLHQEFGSSSTGYLPVDTSFTEILNDKSFSFSLPISQKIAYITIDLPLRVMKTLVGYNPFFQIMVEAGDDVYINLAMDGQIDFKGYGAEKFQWQFEMLRNQAIPDFEQVSFSTNPEQWLKVLNYKLATALESLERNRDKFSNFTYSILKADLVGLRKLYQYRTFNSLDFGYAFNEEIGKIGQEAYKNSLYENIEDTTNQEYLALSAYYASYLMQKTLADCKFSELLNDNPYDPLIDIVNKYQDGILKDRITTAYLFAKKNIIDDEFMSAKRIISTKKYITVLDSIYSIYRRGAEVDDNISFTNSHGKEVKLSDFKGKVILIDIWFSGCTGCVSVANALPKIENVFENDSNMVFLSISIDKSKERWLKSITPPAKLKSEGDININYSHFTTENTIYLYTGGLGNNHEFIKKYNPKGTYPCLLLVDRNGRMFSSSPPRPERENGRELIEVIKQALKSQT